MSNPNAPSPAQARSTTGLSSQMNSSAQTAAYDTLLFEAAGAFSALQRPGRDDADRLDALAMPLFPLVSADGKRRIAAVLSEARGVLPLRLVTALAAEPVAVSASLLISRAELPDSVLEAALATGSAEHARVIRLRSALSASISARIDAVIESVVPRVEVAPRLHDLPADMPRFDRPAPHDITAHAVLPANETVEDMTDLPSRLSETHNALRRMMMRQTIREDLPARMVVEATGGDTLVARLVNLALAGDPDMLATALSDALALPFADIRRVVRRGDARQVMLALKALDLGATDSFAILAAMRPLAFSTAEAIATFYLGFQRIEDSEIDNFRQSHMPSRRSA